jgi:hypothetical protein
MADNPAAMGELHYVLGRLCKILVSFCDMLEG